MKFRLEKEDSWTEDNEWDSIEEDYSEWDEDENED